MNFGGTSASNIGLTVRTVRSGLAWVCQVHDILYPIEGDETWQHCSGVCSEVIEWEPELVTADPTPEELESHRGCYRADWRETI